MATLYTTATVLLFPSHYEGFGLPVLEAQMCGTPVVCSDCGALPEVAEECSLAAPDNVNELMKKILEAPGLGGDGDFSTSRKQRFPLPTLAEWSETHFSLYRAPLQAGHANALLRI
jgi:glycosyltransferase involved in cell wall biosynthesis